MRLVATTRNMPPKSRKPQVSTASSVSETRSIASTSKGRQGELSEIRQFRGAHSSTDPLTPPHNGKTDGLDQGSRPSVFGDALFVRGITLLVHVSPSVGSWTLSAQAPRASLFRPREAEGPLLSFGSGDLHETLGSWRPRAGSRVEVFRSGPRRSLSAANPGRPAPDSQAEYLTPPGQCRPIRACGQTRAPGRGSADALLSC